MRRVLFGHNTSHTAIARSLALLGVVYLSLGKLNDAELVLSECLRMRRAIFGVDASHPDIANSPWDLGWTRNSIGKPVDAQKMLK